MNRSQSFFGAFVAMLALMLAPAGAEAATTSHGDWEALCDDGGDCSAETYVDPETDGHIARYVLRVARKAGKDAAWMISVSTLATLADRDRPIEIRVDGNAPLTLRPESGYAPFGAINDFYLTDPALLATVFKQMQAGAQFRFTFLDLTAAPFDADFSLAGLTAALAWIDETQGRADGSRLAAGPSDLEPAPRVDKGTAIARLGLPARLLALHQAASACEDPNSEHMSDFKPVIGAVSGTAMLYGVPCIASADNVSYRLYIVESGEIGGIEPLYFAAYSTGHGWSGTDLLFNITFDPQTKRLSSRYKGRGRGDCGHIGEWTWNKFAFAMTRFAAWDRCDGSRAAKNWPEIFSAK